MNCKICKNQTTLVKELIIRKKYSAQYFLCKKCCFMSIANPSWIDEAYEKPINNSDTGYITRNVFLSKKALILFSFIFGPRQTYLDYAGGYGVLTRLMRDYGLNFLTFDPHTPNLFAQGFDYKKENITAITCFECLEHFVSPLEEIEKILKISKNIFFSTTLLPKHIPKDDWDYYGAEHGQHVSFYSLETLKFLARKYDLNLCTNGVNLHFLTTRKISSVYFKFILLLSKFQFDIFIRKLLTSKTMTDSLLSK